LGHGDAGYAHGGHAAQDKLSAVSYQLSAISYQPSAVSLEAVFDRRRDLALVVRRGSAIQNVLTADG
jgi:hypothetical protein